MTVNAIRPARPRRGEGRDALLEIARVMFAERGYARTSPKEIAVRAGLTEAMVYRHFGSKAALFEEAAIKPFQQYVSDYVARWRDRPPGARPVLEESRDFIFGLYKVLSTQRRLLLAMSAVREFDFPLLDGRDPLAESAREMLLIFQDLIAGEAGARPFREVDVPAFGRIVVGAILGLAINEPWLNKGQRVGVNRIIDELNYTVIYGVVLRPDAGGAR
jgi:AcrR family transcriptional regulator